MNRYQLAGDFFILFENKKTYVVAANYESTLSKDNDLKEALAKIGYYGPVELDMLLKVGVSKNRFSAIEFDGKQFVRNSSKIIEEASNIKKITSSFFKSHTEVFKNSILSEEQISLAIS